MKKKHLKYIKLENRSCRDVYHPKIKVLKKHEYFIVTGYSITGDAPKAFIRAYSYGTARKDNKKRWPLYIAKTGHKWYPIESITEYLLNRLGNAFGLNMAESNVVMAGGQIRFLSKYFLSKGEELIHGADLFAGYLGDKDFVEEIENKNLARDFFTLQFSRKALKYAYPYHFEPIFEDFIKMLIFDALVGNNDRHFYNWGIVRHIERRYEPVFSPIYDTARGLFWNTAEHKIIEKYRNKSQLDAFIKKYSENSRPKIGWDKENNINHFKLVSKIYKNEFGITKKEINNLLLPANLQKLIDVVNVDFVNLINKERREVIVECLKFRYNSLKKILEN